MKAKKIRRPNRVASNDGLGGYLPKGPVWLLFDLANGGPQKHRYVWWFDTKKAALTHRRWQHKNRNHVRLSKPMLFTPNAEVSRDAD